MLLPLAGVIALGVVWSIYWWIALGYAKAEFANERARLSGHGYDLKCETEDWAGYPFRFEFECRRPIVSLPEGARIESGNWLAVALAYKPWHVIILMNGPTTAVTPDGGFMELRHARAAASIVFDSNQMPAISMELNKVEIAGKLTLEHLLVHTRQGTSGTMDVAASAERFQWSSSNGALLDIDSGKLSGKFAPEPVFDVESVDLRKNNIRYWGSGPVALDNLHRLKGQLSTKTNDINGLLDIIMPLLLMDDSQKANLRMMLGLLGQNAKADIIALDGELYIGPFKVADLLPLY